MRPGGALRLRRSLDSANELCSCKDGLRPGSLHQRSLHKLQPSAPKQHGAGAHSEQQRRRVLARADSAEETEPASSASPLASSSEPPPAERGWGELTNRLCGLSTLPFLFLFMPQVRWQGAGGCSWFVR